MGNAYQFVCLKESKRFILLLAILFAVVIVVQHFELPYGIELPSILSSKASNIRKSYFPAGELTSEFAPERNHSVKSDLEFVSNQTSFQKIIEESEQLKDDGSATSTLEKPINSERNMSSNVTTDVSSLGNMQSWSTTQAIKQNGKLYSRHDSSAVQPAVSSPNTNSDSNLIAPVMPVEQNTYSSPKEEKITPVQENVTRLNNDSSPTNINAVNKIKYNATVLVIPISKMNEFLQKSHSSPHSLQPAFYSKVDKDLVYARSQMENGPIVKSDEDIYTPLYRNASIFKRSYEIMEGMLKVYIYKDGDKPIFHDSILEGIYSCEGWFLTLLEANKQFVTEDPGEAHLFYLPFSSRLLQQTLYVRHSHNRENLIQYMKNYVEMLVAKYPFWNRTDGADHFLAACHDWAPAETRGRMLNCIRGLCNADINVGFNIGKDVSIPTTYVRTAKNPLMDIGGQPPSERSILAFFAGYLHGNVRPVLLQHWGNDTDMRIFSRMPPVKGNKNYIEHMRSSKYCICAKGFAVHSPRVVESIFYECVPVIISDNYVPPLFEALNWESFAVFILEKDIPNLKKILLSISEEKYIEMHKRVKRVQKHFLWHAEPVKYDLFHMILHSIWYNRVFRVSSTV